MSTFIGTLDLRGASYSLECSADDAQLRLRLGDRNNNDAVWTGTFNARCTSRTKIKQRTLASHAFSLFILSVADVEEITHKTGHFQKFPDFVDMLRVALRSGERADIFLDILTYSDLLALKSKRKGSESSSNNASSNNKRYMILTHAGRERVHYPLPLAPDVAAAPPLAPPAQPSSSLPTPAEIRHPPPIDSGPPTFVHHKVQPPSNAIPGHSLARQYDELLREKEEVQAAYERLQRDSTREITKVRRRCEDLASQLQEQSDEMAALQGEMMSHSGDARIVDALRRKLRKVEEQSSHEVSGLQRALDKHKKEIIMVNTELSRSRREEERLRRHVRQLEAELKTTQRRAAAAGSRDGPEQRGRSLSAGRSNSAAGLRPGQLSHVRAPLAARSTASSRASSVASSTAASRANSVTNSRTNSRQPSQPNSRSASADRSRASSAGHSRPASSRASSTENSRPPSRDSRQSGSNPRASSKKASSTQPPSLNTAAREALYQTAMQRQAAKPTSSARGTAPPLSRSSGYAASAAKARTGGAPQAPPRRMKAVSDGGYSSDEWAHGPRRGPVVASGRGGSARGGLQPRSGSASGGRGVSNLPPRSSSAGPRDEKENAPRSAMMSKGSTTTKAPIHRVPASPMMSAAAHTLASLGDEYEEEPPLGAYPGEMMGAEESKSSRMPMAYDATDDIQDIDRRLNALQQFLTAAKAPR